MEMHHIVIHENDTDTYYAFFSAVEALSFVMRRILDFSDAYDGTTEDCRSLKQAWDQAVEDNDPGVLVDEWNDHDQLLMFSYSLIQPHSEVTADHITLPLFPFEH